MFRRKKNEIRRKVFGFPCDTELAFAVRMMAKRIPAAIYPVAEHALQLGGSAIARALEDEESRVELQSHILKEHLLVPVIDPENGYDIRVREESVMLEEYRQEFEGVTRELIEICDQEDVNPRFLLAVSRMMLQDVRERRRHRGDVPRRLDKPEDIASGR